MPDRMPGAGKIHFGFYFHCPNCNRSSKRFEPNQDEEWAVIYCEKCGKAIQKRYFI